MSHTTKVVIFLTVIATTAFLLWGKHGLFVLLPFPVNEPKGVNS